MSTSALEQKVLLALCQKEIYAANKTNLSSKLFEGALEDIYTLIVQAYEKFPELAQLNKSELKVLWDMQNPYASVAQKKEFGAYLEDVFSMPPDIAADVMNSYIHNLWERHVGHKIASLGLALSEGDKEAMTGLLKLLESTRAGFMPTDFGPPTTQDIDVLLGYASNDHRFQFNIETLARHVYGIGRGEFGVVFALPETGKSAFALSLCCAPNGFCDQGAKVLYLGNEERTERIMLRAIQAYTGMTRDEIAKAPAKAKAIFSRIADFLVMNDTQDWDLQHIEAYIENVAPDVVILDQGDKVHIGGTYSASHERLRELFKNLREVAKRRNCAIITISQASAEAKGRTRLSPFDMEGSKIGKAAETDLIIGIGKHEAGDIDDSEIDNSRYLTVSKNKLSGWHGTIICNIEPEVSRYVV